MSYKARLFDRIATGYTDASRDALRFSFHPWTIISTLRFREYVNIWSFVTRQYRTGGCTADHHRSLDRLSSSSSSPHPALPRHHRRHHRRRVTTTGSRAVCVVVPAAWVVCITSLLAVLFVCASPPSFRARVLFVQWHFQFPYSKNFLRGVRPQVSGRYRLEMGSRGKLLLALVFFFGSATQGEYLRDNNNNNIARYNTWSVGQAHLTKCDGSS